MTLRITDTAMTSEQTAHAARHAPGGHGWEVSWLPGQILDRNAAITAMAIAGAAADPDLREGHRLWPHLQSWAGELGLTAPEAIARASQSPGDRRPQPPAASQPAARPRGSRLTSKTQRPKAAQLARVTERELARIPQNTRVTDV